AARQLLPADNERQVFWSAYCSTLCTVVASAALLCLLLFYVCRHFFALAEEASLLLTVFYGFGTLVFSYSTTFYCHLPAASLGFFSFVICMHIKHDAGSTIKLPSFFAGFSAASAFLMEPSAVYILGVVLLYLAGFKKGRAGLLYFFLGCVPSCGLQCFYNAVCFGGAFGSSYTYANPAVMWYDKGSLFGLPRPKKFIELLFLPYRGLFISSPILLMAIPGSALFFKEKKWIPEALACAAVTVVFIVFIACTFAWHGGSAAGPRYLLPAFPFGFMLAIAALKKYTRTFKLLGTLSVLINLAITLVGNEIPREVENPLVDIVLKSILAGKVSINPVPFSNFEKYPHIMDLAKAENWFPNFNSFNLGELIFPHHIASILPLLCFWGIWWYWWKKDAGGNRRMRGDKGNKC
ncbi:MAG: hypothetical protein WCQ99_07415, partial [Pseudomonadota bacterium]